MTIKCPQCGETDKRTVLRQPARHNFLLYVLGGFIGGLFWALSQDTKFQCGQCSHIFYAHTAISRVFWVLCMLIYGIVAVGICYGLWTTFVSSP